MAAEHAERELVDAGLQHGSELPLDEGGLVRVAVILAVQPRSGLRCPGRRGGGGGIESGGDHDHPGAGGGGGRQSGSGGEAHGALHGGRCGTGVRQRGGRGSGGGARSKRDGVTRGAHDGEAAVALQRRLGETVTGRRQAALTAPLRVSVPRGSPGATFHASTHSLTLTHTHTHTHTLTCCCSSIR